MRVEILIPATVQRIGTEVILLEVQVDNDDKIDTIPMKFKDVERYIRQPVEEESKIDCSDVD